MEMQASFTLFPTLPPNPASLKSAPINIVVYLAKTIAYAFINIYTMQYKYIWAYGYKSMSFIFRYRLYKYMCTFTYM